jgi:cell division protein FtsI (penicillin-binding protein 3)
LFKHVSIKERRKREATRWLRLRIRIVFVVFLLLFAALVIRVAKLMLVNRDELYSYAEKQHRVVSTYTTKRGNIYDVNGRDLAVSLQMDSVYACPGQVTDPKGTADLLAKALSMDRSEILARLTSDKGFVWIKRTVPPKTAEMIRDLKPEGIGFVNEDKRFFPHRTLGCHVIGFVGTDSQGLAGIEYQLDRYLKSSVSHFIAVRDAKGNNLFAIDPTEAAALKNYDVFLTIDVMAQHVVEEKLDEAIAEYRADGGCVIVMDPTTGEILAMASRPDFDPNRFSDFRKKSWNNEAISLNFEPGSTFKIFVAAAVLEERLAKKDDPFYCEGGTYRVADTLFRDHGGSFGTLPFADVIRFSSNIGAIKLGALLGRDRLYRYLSAFGFGKPTGVTLPGEEAGMILPKDAVNEVDLASMAFGQGFSVTPIQLITGAAAIANGGLLMEPYVIKRIIDEDGETVMESAPKIRRRAIRPETARTVTEMMRGVVESGTGIHARVEGFDVAGKTGTAEVFDPGAKTYSQTDYCASFVGFLPAGDPRLIILVVLKNPHTSIYGGDVAAPVFQKIARGLTRYLGLYPERDYYDGATDTGTDGGAARFAPMM